MNNIILKKILIFTTILIFLSSSLTSAISDQVLNTNKKDSIENMDTLKEEEESIKAIFSKESDQKENKINTFQLSNSNIIENRDQQLDKKREDFEPKTLGNNGSWWNTSWLYRKQCNISNKIDDYQTKIIVSNNSGGNIYCNGHCKSDFSDLRFINDDGFCLPYWIKEFTIDNNATIWIKNDYNDSSFYVYYGNSNASDLSNGTDTFVYFEDFESYAEDQDPDGKNNWTTDQGSGGSYVKVVTYDGSKVLKINDDGKNPSAYFNFTNQDDIRFYWDVLTNTQDKATYGFDVYDDREGAGGLLFSGIFRYQNDQYVWLPGNRIFNPGKGYSANTWYRDWENQLITSGGYDWNIIDNGTLHDGGGGLYGDYYVDGLDEISFGDATDSWWIIDNLYIACYTNGSEPSFSFGNEENQSSDFESPVISDFDYSISDPIDTDPSFGWENITCTVIDDNEVDEVNLTVTYPDLHTENISIIHAGAGVYYHNTTFSSVGTYSYFIWANDSSGNSNMSSVDTFDIPPNWDIDMDGQIFIQDLVKVSLKYGQSGPNGWIREDVNNDGDIFITDLVQVSLHYGETWS